MHSTATTMKTTVYAENQLFNCKNVTFAHNLKSPERQSTDDNFTLFCGTFCCWHDASSLSWMRMCVCVLSHLLIERKKRETNVGHVPRIMKVKTTEGVTLNETTTHGDNVGLLGENLKVVVCECTKYGRRRRRRRRWTVFCKLLHRNRFRCVLMDKSIILSMNNSSRNFGWWSSRGPTLKMLASTLA